MAKTKTPLIAMTLRHVVDADCLPFFRWWSDRETQRFNGTPTFALTFDAHLKWFIDNYSNPDWYVGLVDGRPVGACRIEVNSKLLPFISIVLAPEERGHGYGTVLIREVSRRCVAKYGEIYARIHRFNAPSICAFTKAGYVKWEAATPFDLYRFDGIRNRQRKER